MNDDKMCYHSKFEEWDDMKGCCPPKKNIKSMCCSPRKKCIKTFDCTFKLYRLSYCRLYKVCQSCGHEYDFYHHRGMCPHCRTKFFSMHHPDYMMEDSDPD